MSGMFSTSIGTIIYGVYYVRYVLNVGFIRNIGTIIYGV